MFPSLISQPRLLTGSNFHPHPYPLLTRGKQLFVDLAWPRSDEKTPLTTLEEELMTETWCLLKEDKEVFSLSPLFLWL